MDAKDEEDIGVMNDINHKSASPYMVHTAVLLKPSLINANINTAIDALCIIVHPDYINSEDVNHLDDDVPVISCLAMVLVGSLSQLKWCGSLKASRWSKRRQKLVT
jgi:hypothetical protein